MVKFRIVNKSGLNPTQKDRLQCHCEVVASDLAVVTKGYDINIEGEVLGDKSNFSVRLNEVRQKGKKSTKALELPEELLSTIYKKLAYIGYRPLSTGEYVRHFIR